MIPTQAVMAMASTQFLAPVQWHGPGSQGTQKLGYESWDHLFILYVTNTLLYTQWLKTDEPYEITASLG